MCMFVNNTEKSRIALPRKHVYLTTCRSMFIMLLDTITLCTCPTNSSDGPHTHIPTYNQTWEQKVVMIFKVKGQGHCYISVLILMS